ncbi:MAG: glycerate dehydrogenase, partial [Deefgea sp.]
MTEPLIVFLDAATLPVPLLAVNAPHRWISYPQTSPDEVVERLQGATVVITNKVPITRDMLAQLPDLKLIAVAA